MNTGESLLLNITEQKTEKIFNALASKPRLRLMELLSNNLYTIQEIAKLMKQPYSTIEKDIAILEDVGLLRTEFTPATTKDERVCQRTYHSILFAFSQDLLENNEKSIEISMPVGSYMDFDIVPTCGLVSSTGIIGYVDIPASFYEPEHIHAQLLWFHSGYVKYCFPNRLPANAKPTALYLNAELCSEAPLFHKDWPSDISVWVNDVDIGFWTCPSDFGGERGLFTPDWWDTFNTQYGLNKTWEINNSGSFIDGKQISSKTLSSLKLNKSDHISVKIGVKADTKNVGGINIFGQKFGNYSQDLVMKINYQLETS